MSILSTHPISQRNILRPTIVLRMAYSCRTVIFSCSQHGFVQTQNFSVTKTSLDSFSTITKSTEKTVIWKCVFVSGYMKTSQLHFLVLCGKFFSNVTAWKTPQLSNNNEKIVILCGVPMYLVLWQYCYFQFNIPRMNTTPIASNLSISCQ